MLYHFIYHYESNTEADTKGPLNEIVNFLTSNNTYSKERKQLTNGLEKITKASYILILNKLFLHLKSEDRNSNEAKSF